MMEGNLWPALRSYWHAVALSQDLTDKPLAARLLDERIALFRLPDGVVCLRDLCIHRGTPLSLGWIEDGRIICAYHGWNYNRCGECVKIPAVPDRPIPGKARVPAYRCTERYGLVWVCLREPRAPIPECPELDEPGFSVDLVGPYTMKCSAARHMENFVDQAHFAWVHDGILGDRAHPETVDVDVERRPEELRYSFVDQPNPMHPTPHKRVYRMYRPFTIHQRKERAGGEVEAAFFTLTAHSVKESTGYLLVMRNFYLDPQEKAERHALDEKITLQDQFILENQRPADSTEFEHPVRDDSERPFRELPITQSRESDHRRSAATSRRLGDTSPPPRMA